MNVLSVVHEIIEIDFVVAGICDVDAVMLVIAEVGLARVRVVGFSAAGIYGVDAIGVVADGVACDGVVR